MLSAAGKNAALQTKPKQCAGFFFPPQAGLCSQSQPIKRVHLNPSRSSRLGWYGECISVEFGGQVITGCLTVPAISLYNPVG